jgi:CubicO group peptidase (beta-lactamase class C family)
LLGHSSLSMFTSLADLSRAGAAILASSLLPKATTRRWLKPVAHTSNIANSVGLPWTVYSQRQENSSLITEVYTVFGGVEHYTSYIGLVPAYGVGFAILSADAKGQSDLNAHADIVGDEIFPAVVKAAAGYTAQAFAGAYHTIPDDMNAT